jgi:hypothetical protein
VDQGTAALSIKHADLAGPFSSLEMLLPSVFVAIVALPALISGGQIPVVNGVIGGVPSPDSCKFKTPKEAFSNYAAPPVPTPGKLRVVENSGVCGEAISFATHPLSYRQFWQKLRQVSIRRLDMVTWLPIRVSGLSTTSAHSFFLISVPPAGSGSLPHAETLTKPHSSLGSMVA